MLTKTDDLKAAVAHVATIKPALGFVRVRCTDAGLSVTGIAEDGTTVCGYTGARPAPGETAVMFRWASLRNFIKALPKGTATVEMAPAPGESHRLIVRCDAGEFAILSTVGLPPVRRGRGPTRYSLALPDLTQRTPRQWAPCPGLPAVVSLCEPFVARDELHKHLGALFVAGDAAVATGRTRRAGVGVRGEEGVSIRHGYKWCVVSGRLGEGYRTLYGARMAARVVGGRVERINAGGG